MHDLNGHQLRKGRFSATGNIYLLTTVTHQRQPFFSDWRLGRLVVHQMRYMEREGLVHSMAWVVMPDHLHWLIALEQGSLAALMSRMKSRSSQAFKERTRYSGAVWQKGYHDRALRRDEDLQQAARYIVANPLRAGLVKRLGDYPLWDAVWL
ncbi:transposase [Xanthomonas sp. WHRI 1810A]|uniref:REP-associated tyrosine transposase n=1 Tax=Xanthomonas sp. WHRI 1810A TaxID=3161565 RepID=UPI0032E87A46